MFILDIIIKTEMKYLVVIVAMNLVWCMGLVRLAKAVSLSKTMAFDLQFGSIIQMAQSLIGFSEKKGRSSRTLESAFPGPHCRRENCRLFPVGHSTLQTERSLLPALGFAHIFHLCQRSREYVRMFHCRLFVLPGR